MSIALVDFNSQVTVRRRRYASEESGWAVIEAAGDDGDSIVLVGPLIHLEERERAHVVGRWVDDSRYGLQVKVSEATPLPPTDLESVAIYLRRVKHVGAKRAQKLIDRYGIERVLEAVDADPETAFAEAGLRRGAGRGGGRFVGAHAGHPQAASVARSPWARLPGVTAPRGVRRLRRARGQRASLRVDQRVRRGLRHRRSDRAWARRRGGWSAAQPRRRPPRARRGRARRQHVPADRRAARLARRAARRARRPGADRRARRGGRSGRAGALDLPAPDRRARGRARGARARARRERAERSTVLARRAASPEVPSSRPSSCRASRTPRATGCHSSPVVPAPGRRPRCERSRGSPPDGACA